MNILQQEDIIKGLPDDALMQEAQAPSGQVPQFLVVSEVQRRADMRKRYQEQQQPQGTVAEQIVGEAQQGIASMQQQGGPPPPQAMPPQGMPPQGMPPQGMPPQQMFGGGIIRLQGGGFLGKQTVAGAGTVKSQIDAAVAGGATMADLLSIFKNHPEAISYVQQLYGSGVTLGLPSREQRISADRNRVASIREGIAPLSEGISPLGTYGSTPEEFQAQRGSMPDLGIAGFLSDMKERGAQSLEQAAPNRQFIADFLSGEYQYEPESVGRKKDVAASAERMAGVAPESLESDPAFFSDIMSEYDSIISGPEQAAPQETVPEETFPELSTAIKQAQENPNDAGSRAGSRGQVQGLNDATRQGRPDPSLDFADLIAESKKMSQANALMQLGAGIAGGDLSKGLSAAGTAATRGAQDARKLAMTQRLAEYNAGRQDLDREQKESQFSRRLELMTDQLDAAIQKGERVSKGQLLDMATELALESASEFGGGPSAEKIFEELLRRFAPFMGVDTSSLPPSEIVSTTRSGQTTGRPPLSDFLD